MSPRRTTDAEIVIRAQSVADAAQRVLEALSMEPFAVTNHRFATSWPTRAT